MVHYLHINQAIVWWLFQGSVSTPGKKKTKKQQQQQQQQQQLTEAYLSLPRESEMFEMVSVVNNARV